MANEITAVAENRTAGSIVQTVLLGLVVGGVAAGVWFGFPLGTAATASRSPAVNVEGMTTSIVGVPTRGNAAAKVVVIEFSDFQCPFCGSFANETQPELVAKYVDTGKVAWSFRQLPLPEIHRQAVSAAEAAECAGRQGRFWQAHDALFRNQQELAKGDALALVQDVIPDRSALAACVNDGAARPRLGEDLKEANRLGFRSTPVFVLGTRQPDGNVRISTALPGARSAANFSAAIDALLAR